MEALCASSQPHPIHFPLTSQGFNGNWTGGGQEADKQGLTKNHQPGGTETRRPREKSIRQGNVDYWNHRYDLILGSQRLKPFPRNDKRRGASGENRRGDEKKTIDILDGDPKQWRHRVGPVCSRSRPENGKGDDHEAYADFGFIGSAGNSFRVW